WLEEYTSTEEYAQRRDLFIYRYSPSRRAAEARKVEAISPYDSLLRNYSKELGWDWRLLAAVVYQESKFHIEAVSPRGAQGLMQIRPRTATRFNVTDPLDPEQNIRAGAAFLKRLQNLFKNKAADSSELVKFTLAAYNAGEGKITDCLNLAGYNGLDPGYWENVISVIPQMRDSSIFDIDTVKHGMFYGEETIQYVDKVLELYEDFKKIRPE
ncbi:MAG: transglycosylase SLT domain-containing protein, partial [Bacteroidia bacterium]|nr:transglycosylase SLT domain-containing protein [Bacteroidia bacterium]